MRTTSSDTMIHLGADDPLIECVSIPSQSRADLGFFTVLRVGPARMIPADGRAVAQLREIRAAIDGYLASPDGLRLAAIESEAEPAPAEPAAVTVTESFAVAV